MASASFLYVKTPNVDVVTSHLCAAMKGERGLSLTRYEPPTPVQMHLLWQESEHADAFHLQAMDGWTFVEFNAFDSLEEIAPIISADLQSVVVVTNNQTTVEAYSVAVYDRGELLRSFTVDEDGYQFAQGNPVVRLEDEDGDEDDYDVVDLAYDEFFTTLEHFELEQMPFLSANGRVLLVGARTAEPTLSEKLKGERSESTTLWWEEALMDPVSLPQVAAAVDVEREPGWLYFLDADGDVARVNPDSGSGAQKVARTGVERKEGFLYTIDERCNVMETRISTNN